MFSYTQYCINAALQSVCSDSEWTFVCLIKPIIARPALLGFTDFARPSFLSSVNSHFSVNSNLWRCAEGVYVSIHTVFSTDINAHMFWKCYLGPCFLCGTRYWSVVRTCCVFFDLSVNAEPLYPQKTLNSQMSTADQFSMHFCCDITTNPNLTASLYFTMLFYRWFQHTCFVDKVMTMSV